LEIKTEHKSLSAEKKDLNALLKEEGRQWDVISWQLKEIQKEFGAKTPLGKRRTELGDAPAAVVVPIESMIEKEPVTVVLSAKGWVRAMKGHREDLDDLKFKEGDQIFATLRAQSTDKI